MEQVIIKTEEANGRGCDGCIWWDECSAKKEGSMNDIMIKLGLDSCETGIIFIKGEDNG